MERIYYIVVNNAQQGPYTKEELRIKNLSPETLIWRNGMPQWMKLAELPEMADIIYIESTEETVKEYVNEDNGWYAMLGTRRLGPTTPSELIAAGVGFNTPVWHAGMPDWATASTQPDFMERLNANLPPNYGQAQPQSQYPNFSQNPQYGQPRDFSQNPQYGQQRDFSQNPQYGQQSNLGQNPQYGQSGYGQNPQYGRSQFNNQVPRTNWMPWAIVATVVTFLFSCIGVIFGIIGIVQANKANNLYSAGFEGEAEQANNMAKIMTIIAFVLAGVGLITTGFIFKNFSAFSYF